MKVHRAVGLTVSAPVLFIASAFSQNLPTIPPSHDPAFWSRTNRPYVLTEQQTTFNANGNETHAGQQKVYRNSAGVVREESFYNSGKLMSVMLRDAGSNTITTMQMANKTAWVAENQFPPPTPGQWRVEHLEPRVIAGVQAQGLRFTRTTTASPDGNGPSVQLVEEDWVSNDLGIVLERTISNGTVKTTEVVTQLQSIEPDPSLFTVPEGFTAPRTSPGSSGGR